MCFGLLCQHSRKNLAVNVSSGQDYADSFAAPCLAVFQQSSERGSARTLGYVVRIAEYGAHRVFDFVIGHLIYALQLTAQDLQTGFVGARYGNAIGNSCCCLLFYDASAGKR